MNIKASIKKFLLLRILGGKTTYKIQKQKILLGGEEIPNQRDHYVITLIQKEETIGVLMIVRDGADDFIGNFLALEGD